ncbi:MAG: extracellular solute-binding protein [Clostridiales bacterium]|nr:extracellular solute-binding protein [Clostridiales bacterium]
MRRILVLVMALSLLAGVAQAAQLSGVNEFPLVQERAELKFFASQSADIKDLNTNVWTQKYEEMTNVHIVWETTPSESQIEKVNLLLAAQELPDVFFGCSTAITTTVETIHGAAGTFVDLKPYIDQQGYYIKKMFEEVPYIEPAITTPTGQIWSLPQVNECFHCYYSQKMWINREWLNKLGLEFPTTTDEFKDVLIAFRDGDPNGNGLKDEIPLMASATGGWQNRIWAFLMCAFTYTNQDNAIAIADDGDTVELSYMKPEFREGLKYLADLYKEGLIGEATFTQTGEDLKTVIESGDALTVGAVPSGWFGAFAELSGDRQKQFDALAPLKGPDGVQLCGWFPYGYGSGQFVVTSACKDPALAVKWADYLCSEDAALQYIEAGREGIEWRMGAEGELDVWGRPAKWTRLDTEFNYSEAQNIHYYQMGPSYRSFNYRESWYVPQTEEDYYGTAGYEARLHVETQKYVDHHPSKVFPNIYYSEDDANEIQRLQTSIRNYRDEMITAFIVGTYDINSDDDWQSYLDGLESFGASTYLSVLQRNYDVSPLKDAVPSAINANVDLSE